MHPYAHFKVRRHPQVVGPHVESADQLVGEDDLLPPFERGRLRQAYEYVVPSGGPRSARTGRSAREAVGIADAAVRHGLLERHHRADAVPLVEPLVVLTPRGGSVRTSAQPGQDERCAFHFPGHCLRQHELGVQL